MYWYIAMNVLFLVPNLPEMFYIDPLCSEENEPLLGSISLFKLLELLRVKI